MLASVFKEKSWDLRTRQNWTQRISSMGIQRSEFDYDLYAFTTSINRGVQCYGKDV